jgi:glutathione S-transferase
MKLVGSLTSPYVRKVRVMLLEKNLAFEFIVDSPWEPNNRVSEFNPLGKVPALVTDEGETFFDSTILAEYIELAGPLTGTAPRLLPDERMAALRVRQLATLADGICDAAVAVFLEGKRVPERQEAGWIERQQGKISRGLDQLDSRAAANEWLAGNSMTLADISTGCMLFWLDFRLPALNWRSGRPALEALAAKLSERPSFAQTRPVA